MAIKYGDNNVTDVVWDTDKVVTAIIFNDSYVYARSGYYWTGSLPQGVASLTCTRTSTLEPTAGTGTIGNGGTIYHGDTLSFSATPSTYWNLNGYTTACTVSFMNTRELVGQSVAGVSAYPQTRTVSVTKNTGVSAITVSYYSGTSSTSQTFTVTDSITASAPWGVSWTASAEANWAMDSGSGSTGAGTSTYYISPTASRIGRYINLSASGHYTLYLSYTDTGNNPQSTSTTGTSSVLAWQGTGYSWSTGRDSYWLLSGTSSGSGTVSDTVNISGPTAYPYTRTFTVDCNGYGINSSYIEYTNPSLTPTSSSSTATTHNVDAWTGASVAWSVSLQTGWTTNNASGSIGATEDARSVAIRPTAWMNSVTLNLPNHISVATLNYYDSAVTPASQSTQSYSSGYLQASARHGYNANYSVAYESPGYYSSPASGSFTVDGDKWFDIPAPSPYMRTFSITPGAGVAQYSVNYLDSNGNLQSTYAYAGTSPGYLSGSAWAGGAVTYGATAQSGWKAPATVTVGASTSNVSATIVCEQSSYTLYYTIGSGVGYMYIYRNGTTVASPSSSGSLTADPGYTYTFSVIPLNYWKNGTASPTRVPAGQSSNITVTASASKNTRSVTITPQFGWSAGGIGTLSYVSGTGTSTSRTNTRVSSYTSLNVWQGGAVTWSTSAANSYWSITGGGSWSAGSSSISISPLAILSPSGLQYCDAEYSQSYMDGDVLVIEITFSNYTNYTCSLNGNDSWINIRGNYIGPLNTDPIEIESRSTGTAAWGFMCWGQWPDAGCIQLHYTINGYESDKVIYPS